MEMGAKKRERPGGLTGGREGKICIQVREGGYWWGRRERGGVVPEDWEV